MNGPERMTSSLSASDVAELRRLLSSQDQPHVTLVARCPLSEYVMTALHGWLVRLAGRDVTLLSRVDSAADAGAVLVVADKGRLILDPGPMLVDEVGRRVSEAVSFEGASGIEDVFRLLHEELSALEPRARLEELSETGIVTSSADGVASVIGLRGVGLQERVEFESGVSGIALSLAEDSVKCLLLGDDSGIREGSYVRRSGGPVEVPVGDGLLGRVIDAMGEPIDGHGPVVASARRPVNAVAPGVVHRQPVDTPLHTGIKIIDSLVPIGRGQRELIVGDRKTGKTTLAVDTIIAQTPGDVRCVYCAIGQKASTIRAIVNTLEAHDAMRHTVVVAAMPSDPAAQRYLAPYTACTIAELFRDRGQDALVIYDDLTKHAATYRELSALLERPVGREAYPGDMFYIHSGLLERAARLCAEDGGGSLTAIPVAETLAGDLSSFIPTNLISICDGQIVLDTATFNEGRRPAVDAGLSVSRVGGAAQSAIMREIAGTLRIDLAQFKEMARFVKFGAEVDEATSRQLQRGERIQALLAQDQHVLLTQSEELLVLYAAISEAIDVADPADFRRVEMSLMESHDDLEQRLHGASGLTPALRAELDAIIGNALPSLHTNPGKSNSDD